MNTLLTYLPTLLDGLGLTILLLLFSVVIGFALAIAMTIATFSDQIFLKKSVNAIGFFFRGTPLLVQFFLIYYGLSQFDFIRDSFLWPVLRNPITCAIIALSINSGCYTTILLQGAIRSVPANQMAACQALGMSKWLAFRRILFPCAFRMALPAYSNEVIMLLKGTSLASTITVLELMGVTQQLLTETYAPFTFYIVAGLLYLVLNGIIYGLFKLLFKWSAIPERAIAINLSSS